jgi:hypothetical protein
MRRKPGTDTKFPAQFAETGCLSQGLPAGYAVAFVVPPKRLSTGPRGARSIEARGLVELEGSPG